MSRRSTLLLILAASSSGCIAYAPSVDVELRDSRRAWLESMVTHERYEPKALDRETPLPGNLGTMERSATGAIELHGRTVVGHDGAVRSALDSLEGVHRDGDYVRVRLCTRSRLGGGCDRDLRLATTFDNVRLLRSQQVPVRLVGIMELALASGAFTAHALAPNDEHASGRPLLLGAGVILALVGMVQLFAPAKDVDSIVPSPGQQ